MSSRPAPRDLRASDADREQVVSLLAEAAADGRLQPSEHAERIQRAYSARTLGDLAGLTDDLAAPGAQPIRLDAGRAVAGIFSREHRDGRWVVPESLVVTALFGEVVLDFRQALLQSQRVTLYATAIGGQVHLIVPEGTAVQMAGTVVLGRNSNRASRGRLPGMPLIDVRTCTVAGQVVARSPRRGGWLGSLRPGR